MHDAYFVNRTRTSEVNQHLLYSTTKIVIFFSFNFFHIFHAATMNEKYKADDFLANGSCQTHSETATFQMARSNDTGLAFQTQTAIVNIFEEFGPSHPQFKLIHYTAIVSLTISIIISFYTLVHSIRSGNGHILKRKIGRYRFPVIGMYMCSTNFIRNW